MTNPALNEGPKLLGLAPAQRQSSLNLAACAWFAKRVVVAGGR